VAPTRRSETRFGIDIGGTAIKGAPVDLGAGRLLEARERIETPRPASSEAVADVVADIVERFGWKGSVGCTFPGVVKRGVTLTAANVGPELWVGVDADGLLTERLGRSVHLLNDADAAGLAEARYGAARDLDGVAVVVTIGTGLGTAVLTRGVLVPNTELGHIRMRGTAAEKLASERARIDLGLSWKAWAANLDDYLALLETYLNPDRIVLGGGGAKRADKFLHLLQRTCEVVLAELSNDAGIVGAAMVAEDAAR
jgi:polyphosphate glucokinase